MKYFISITIVKWFKSFPFAGRFRFHCLYLAYRLTGWHIRHLEWDFVLKYLPPLGKWQKVSVLDVGCSRNLFCYEVLGRGYNLTGIDLEKPDFKYPGYFYKDDIRKTGFDRKVFDFITCISVFEHIKADERGNQCDALEEMISLLKIGGRLLLTIPTNEFAQGHPWHGFDYKHVDSILSHNSKILEYTEYAGQICLCIGRIA